MLRIGVKEGRVVIQLLTITDKGQRGGQEPDMEFVKKFTQARFLKTKF